MHFMAGWGLGGMWWWWLFALLITVVIVWLILRLLPRTPGHGHSH